jgi:hypothetical protein
MFIPDPDFYPSRIQQQQQMRKGKNLLSLNFLWPQVPVSQNWKKKFCELVEKKI